MNAIGAALMFVRSECARHPFFSQTDMISGESVATMHIAQQLAVLCRFIDTLQHGLPRDLAQILRGKRVEAMRAGMMATAFIAGILSASTEHLASSD